MVFQKLFQNLVCYDEEGPTFLTKSLSSAASSDIIIVIHININDKLSSDGSSLFTDIFVVISIIVVYGADVNSDGDQLLDVLPEFVNIWVTHIPDTKFLAIDLPDNVGNLSSVIKHRILVGVDPPEEQLIGKELVY